jgi:hypothetical protein
MKLKHSLLALAAPIAFVACENPADKTTTAGVAEAVEKTTESADGVRFVFTPESEVNFIGSATSRSRTAPPWATTTRWSSN